jgi:nucleoside-diphosphate-sugar epimerase
MRILVTGGSGFVGSAVVRTAVAQGNTVAILSRTLSTGGNGDVRVLQGNLSDPPWDAIAAFAPEACIHSAWIATPGVYLESPENEAWVEWSLKFLAGSGQRGVRRIVSLGTCIEYRITGGRLSESSTPLAPASRYARCKADLYVRLRELPELKECSLAWGRLFYPYGAGEHPARFASSAIVKIRAGERVFLKTPHSIKDYIHIDDVARAILTVMDAGFEGAINLGTGEGIQIETMARTLAGLLGRPELVETPEVVAVDPLDYVVADASRLRGLDWKPQVGLESGLLRLIEAVSR